ncbi:sco-spondin-like [Plakobranchus ocellatus]|uniref:Sco-spondin-like n=1 Tax=Plakobranchus ocellatus TaxID=259542 RepID=A0AAV3ZMM1_9GAST|nr:sco-spondin-like [Plakobranchus ocellatus]
MIQPAIFPVFFLILTVWSSQRTWLAGGQQIIVHGDLAEGQDAADQNHAGVTLFDTPYLDMSTMASSFEDNDSNRTDGVTEVIPEPPKRPILGVGDYKHSDQVFLWTSHQEMYTSADKGLLGHVFLTIKSKRTTFQCALECLKHARCLSFNFWLTSDLCELSDTSHVESPESISDVTGCEYHARSSYSVDQVGNKLIASRGNSGSGVFFQ